MGRLEVKLQGLLSDTLYGFRNEKSTEDVKWVQCEVYIFVDFPGAFDSLEWTAP